MIEIVMVIIVFFMVVPPFLIWLCHLNADILFAFFG